MSVQTALFEPTTQTVTFIQFCHLCGQPVATIPLDDVSQPWAPSTLWGYVALKDHIREQHRDQYDGPVSS